MENSNRSNENAFVEFFKGLDENYQLYLINEMKRELPDENPNFLGEALNSLGDEVKVIPNSTFAKKRW
ncbi:hypothetical protein [Enterococcus dongliensis]|uniref:hypothetical protein n=1 Tax=Enterococcus dongliensis TaxID=2559925 RepID=UPI00288D3137|nr:hypothetical protein [Enterococcus dongliensis]MDT2674302.1 hypothetical protein [Enterococcus dongliensis]